MTLVAEAEETGTAATAPSRRWTTGDFTRAGVVVVAWQAVLTVFGAVLERALHLYAAVAQGQTPGPSLLSHTFRWDAGWFASIVNVDAYAREPVAAAFYPLFPLTVRVVKHLGFGTLGFLAAGLVVNTVATWLGATALLKIARTFVSGDRTPWLAVAAFLTAPTAFFLHAFYSEATFIALGFWAYLFALRRQWVFMGLCLVPITATRITAVLFVALCFLEFWRARGWRLRGLLSWNLLWFPASLIGFACYALYLKLVGRDPLGMLKAYGTNKDWSYHVFDLNVFATVDREVSMLWRAFTGVVPLDHMMLVNHVLPVTGLAVLLVASGYLIFALRGDGVPLGVFGLLSFLMFTLNSNTVSVHRYLLPCLGLYVTLVLAVRRRPALRPVACGVLYLNAMLQAVLFVMFIQGTWAG